MVRSFFHLFRETSSSTSSTMSSMSTGQQATPLIRSTHRHRDHVISQEDFDDLNDRVRHYMDWSTNNMNYQTLKEVSWYLAND